MNVKKKEEEGDVEVEEGEVTAKVKEGEQEVDMEEHEVNVRREHEGEEGEGTVQKELPKINKTRRRRNIIVGWLCSKICC